MDISVCRNTSARIDFTAASIAMPGHDNIGWPRIDGASGDVAAAREKVCNTLNCGCRCFIFCPDSKIEGAIDRGLHLAADEGGAFLHADERFGGRWDWFEARWVRVSYRRLQGEQASMGRRRT